VDGNERWCIDSGSLSSAVEAQLTGRVVSPSEEATLRVKGKRMAVTSGNGSDRETLQSGDLVGLVKVA
jgi:hypothetical protein